MKFDFVRKLALYCRIYWLYILCLTLIGSVSLLYMRKNSKKKSQDNNLADFSSVATDIVAGKDDDFVDLSIKENLIPSNSLVEQNDDLKKLYVDVFDIENFLYRVLINCGISMDDLRKLDDNLKELRVFRRINSQQHQELFKKIIDNPLKRLSLKFHPDKNPSHYSEFFSIKQIEINKIRDVMGKLHELALDETKGFTYSMAQNLPVSILYNQKGLWGIFGVILNWESKDRLHLDLQEEINCLLYGNLFEYCKEFSQFLKEKILPESFCQFEKLYNFAANIDSSQITIMKSDVDSYLDKRNKINIKNYLDKYLSIIEKCTQEIDRRCGKIIQYLQDRKIKNRYLEAILEANIIQRKSYFNNLSSQTIIIKSLMAEYYDLHRKNKLGDFAFNLEFDFKLKNFVLRKKNGSIFSPLSSLKEMFGKKIDFLPIDPLKIDRDISEGLVVMQMIDGLLAEVIRVFVGKYSLAKIEESYLDDLKKIFEDLQNFRQRDYQNYRINTMNELDKDHIFDDVDQRAGHNNIVFLQSLLQQLFNFSLGNKLVMHLGDDVGYARGGDFEGSLSKSKVSKVITINERNYFWFVMVFLEDAQILIDYYANSLNKRVKYLTFEELIKERAEFGPKLAKRGEELAARRKELDEQLEMAELQAEQAQQQAQQERQAKAQAQQQAEQERQAKAQAQQQAEQERQAKAQAQQQAQQERQAKELAEQRLDRMLERTNQDLFTQTKQDILNNKYSQDDLKNAKEEFSRKQYSELFKLILQRDTLKSNNVSLASVVQELNNQSTSSPSSNIAQSDIKPLDSQGYSYAKI